MSKVIIKKRDKNRIMQGSDIVRNYAMGSIGETTHAQKKVDKLKNYKKLNKYEYCVMETGGIYKYNKSETKEDNLESVKRNMKQVTRTISTNFEGLTDEIMITLTYKENMTDTERLTRDIDKFNKRFRYKIGHYEYINLVEPQERGAWHAHILIKLPEGKTRDIFGTYFINKTGLREYRKYNDDVISKIWTHGKITHIQALQDVTRVDLYLTAYLTNVKDGKLTKKGARLKLYPSGMKIMRCSKGIKKPIVEDMKYSEVQEKYQDLTKEVKTTTYDIYDIDLIDDIDEISENTPNLNSITKVNYKVKKI